MGVDAGTDGSAQSVLDALPMQLTVLDEGGRILLVNRAWTLFAEENGAVAPGPGASYLDACGGGDEGPAVARAIRDALAPSATSTSVDYPCHSPERRRWFRVTLSPFALPEGRRGVLVVHHDITAEHAAFESLSASEARLRLLLESEPECVKEVSADDRLLFMNPAGLSMIEAPSLEAARGRVVSQVVHPEDRARYRALHERALGGEAGRAEFRVVGDRGATRTVDSHAVPLRGDDGRVTSVVSVTRDVTSERRAFENARATRERMEAILGSLTEGVHVVDRDGRIVYQNSSAIACFGHGVAIGQLAHETVHHHRADGAPYPAHDCPILQTLRDGRTRRVTDEVFFRGDGVVFPVEYTCTALRDREGSVEGVVVSFRDVAEERATRERLAESSSLLASAQRLGDMGTWDLDVASGKLHWSAETLALFGFAADDFGASYAAFVSRVHPDDRAALEAAHRHGLETGVIEAQYRVVRPDRSVRWVYERGQVVRGPDGQVTRRLGVVMDVTRLNDALAALKASEELFRQVFTHAAAGIAITTPGGVFLDANRAYCDMLGYSADELRERDVRGVTHADDRARNEELLRELLGGRRDSFVLEKRYCKRSGEALWARVSVAVVRDGAGTPVRVVAVAEDIDEQRRATEGLLERDRMLRVASRVARFGAWTVSRAGLAFECSEESRAILELEPDARPSLETLLVAYLPEHRAHVAAAIDECLQRGEPFDREAELVTARGRRCCVRLIGEAVLDEHGEVRGIHGALQDISERKAFERSLEESERRFREFAASMPVIVWTATPDGLVDYASRTFPSPTGAARTLEPTGGWRDVVHPGDLAGSTEAWQRCLTTGEPFRVDIRLGDATGGYRWHQVGATAARDRGGAIVKWHGTVIDVDATHRAEEHARSLAGELVAAFESITDVLFSLDHERRLVYTNARAVALMGGTVALVGRPLTAVLEPGLEQVVSEAIATAMASGTPQEIDAQDGRSRAWYVGRAYPSGRGCVVYLRDESETRRAREALRASEERFRLLGRATNDAIWDWDREAETLWWNEGFETLFGHSRAAIEPTTTAWDSLVHPEDHDRVIEAVQEAVARGQDTWCNEYRFQRADGSWAYVLDRGHAIRDPSGRVVRMVGGMTDLSERRANEEQLREQAALLENARDAILVRDLEGNIRYVNRRAEELYGWRRDAVLGRNVCDLQFRGSRSAFEQANQTTIRQEEWTGELEQVCADGQTVLVEGRWTLLRDRAGQPYGILAINTDIRDRKKLELQLIRAQRLESIGTLAGGIAHDLNNVLTPILCTVGVMRQEEQDAVRLDDLVTIESCARRGSDMVRQLLLFARGYDGQRAPLALDRLLADLEHILRDTFPRNITLSTTIPAAPWVVEADATQLDQVLMNLCVNARDAMPSGGRLHIALENVVLDDLHAGMNPGAHAGPYVLIRVEDSGLGMAPDVAERAFEPFFTTKPIGKGTGLGLSTTHAIVKSHGGFINLYSEVGKGTRFHVYLPARPEAADSERVAVARSGLPRGNGECVLVVDDEESIRTMVQRTLERFGYRVLTAGNGAEALATFALRRGEIAAVLTDMAMPIMDGAALIVALRSLDASTRIVGSSGLDSNGKVAAAMGAGVKHFVAKPYTAETLLRTLRAVLVEPADG